jgi:alanyl-tRNA synthetase
LHPRAPADPYTREFTATVERVTDRSVTLDRTFFYPEGGGQPADRGVPVAYVQTVDDAVVHELDDVAPSEAGETVECVVDADEVVAQVTEAFGGGGGGSPTVAQAGGLDGGAAEVVSSLRDTVTV